MWKPWSTKRMSFFIPLCQVKKFVRRQLLSRDFSSPLTESRLKGSRSITFTSNLIFVRHRNMIRTASYSVYQVSTISQDGIVKTFLKGSFHHFDYCISSWIILWRVSPRYFSSCCICLQRQIVELCAVVSDNINWVCEDSANIFWYEIDDMRIIEGLK